MLNRFISKAAEKAIPLFHTLKGCIEKNNFRWTPDAESALQEIKKALHTLPTLANPVPGETMQVYLSASKDAILSVLVVEWQGRQLPIYFTSSVFPGPPDRSINQLPDQASAPKARDIRTPRKMGH